MQIVNHDKAKTKFIIHFKNQMGNRETIIQIVCSSGCYTEEKKLIFIEALLDARCSQATRVILNTFCTEEAEV